MLSEFRSPVDNQYERLCDSHPDQNAVAYKNTYSDKDPDTYTNADTAADEYPAANRNSQGDIHAPSDIYRQTDVHSQGDIHAASYDNADAD